MLNWCSVTVTFNPQLETLLEQMRTVTQDLRGVIIVDNASDNIQEIEAIVNDFEGRISLIKFKANAGIGRALNAGIDQAIRMGNYDFILTLDQDTTFYHDSFDNAESEASVLVNSNGPGLFGFNFTKKRFSRDILVNYSGNPSPVNFLITSGTIISREILDLVKFDESLFIYFVDNDFCINVRKLGFQIVVLARSRMRHSEGQRQLRGGKSYFYIAPERMYYLTRNSLIMLKRHGYCIGIVYAGYVVLMNLFAGISLLQMLKSSIKGFKDGINGR